MKSIKTGKEKDNIALYRKYRPESFDQILGQDHIVKTIAGSLEAGKISHAYLFYGPRGTGKTTIARIIAKVLGTSSNDIYELDAASNRGIDEVRSIKDGVGTMPFDSKYKIYILDEVHMFTTQAWNALLKTIEEPPAHVIFILATTDIDKVPETIMSRCQSFSFRRPSDAILSKLIKKVATKEGYVLDDGVAELIALLADGAFRDALGILQKVISFSKDKKINILEVEEITGAPDGLLVCNFLDALAQNDIDKGLLAIDKAVSQNIEMTTYLKMILYKLRYALMLRYAPSTRKSIENVLSGEDLAYLEKLISNKPINISSTTLSILLETYQDTRNAVISQLPLELALIKILNADK